MPTGGVDLKTAGEFLKAGACCLGIGSQLIEPKAVAERNFDRIRDLAGKYVAIVKEFRDFYGLRRHSLKNIDKFLWRVGASLQ